jgi:hypothetical protein
VLAPTLPSLKDLIFPFVDGGKRCSPGRGVKVKKKFQDIRASLARRQGDRALDVEPKDLAAEILGASAGVRLSGRREPATLPET